jgi:hypothetical protein
MVPTPQNTHAGSVRMSTLHLVYPGAFHGFALAVSATLRRAFA